MHTLAAREAVDRFATELPQGANADRLRRLADATRQLFDQAVGDRRAAVSGWADHNLGVLVAEALGPESTRDKNPFSPAGAALYLGVRRRLLEALANDPDDLACALALALGAAATLEDRDDLRLSEDLTAVTRALTRPGAGPRLAAAATRAVTQAGARLRRGGDRRGEDAERDERAEAMQKAAAALAGAVRENVERLGKRLPEHPELALDRIRLVLLAARGAEGTARSEALSMARALLSDHEARFGPSDAQREVTSTLVQLRAKDASPADLARDVIALLELDARDRRVDPRRAIKLVRSLQRAGALDAEAARRVQAIALIGAPAGADEGPWAELKGLLFEALGDEAALLTLQEKALEKDPKDAHAARLLFERLLKNLRRSLPSPFPSATLDLIVQAVPFAALGKLSADDVDALTTLLTDTFGHDRALGFARHKLTQAKELRSREFIWKKALHLAEEAKDDEALLDIARRANQEKHASPEARLALAKALLAKGQDLDEADDVLRPLASDRGPLAAEAQQLKARIKADPRYREARVNALLAFEEQLGIGTPRPVTLKVVFTAPAYVLAEITDKPAPDFYEHKHLRVMVRGEDLPDKVKPTDLNKGDELKAPVRGQDSTHERDRDALRIYWIADARQVRLAVAPDQIVHRLEAEEKHYGIGEARPLPLKVSWDAKKKRLVARLLDAGGREFRVRPSIEIDQLPEAMEAAHVGGRGKRFWGAVERVGASQYKVVGKVVAAAPEGAATPAEAPEAPEAPTETAATSEAATTTETVATTEGT